ncbi:MAG: GPR endopeptidase [Lachnospiraceae bacterium]
MLGNFLMSVRTLALEARESFEEDDVKIRGVRVETREDEEKEIRTTLVKIETENGARTMGKPVGTYITMEAPNMSGQDEDYHREISEELAYHLKKMIGEQEQSVLVVGLGNRDVTPDALGPRVVSNIEITRHMIREYGRGCPSEGKRASKVSSLVPGVMAQTGMETLEIIKGVVEETRPDVVLVIDALAARNTRAPEPDHPDLRYGHQSGFRCGNHRNGINKEALGVPVISIGVPTVVDAATIVGDTMEEMVETLDSSGKVRGFGGALGTLNRVEKQQMIRELLSPHLNTMYVTPKDIDETVKGSALRSPRGLTLRWEEWHSFPERRIH